MSIFIYNIALQNTYFGVLQKSSKHFLIYIFFPPFSFRTPPPPPPPNKNKDLFCTILVRDRFIARQMECSLHRHFDSVEPGTPIWDIVDRCHVWESHADFTDCRGDRPIPKRPLPVYMIDDAGTENGQPELAPEVISEDQDMLGSLIRHLLPTPAVSPPRATPIPSEHDLQESSSFTDMEILLQSLLPVGSPATEQPRPMVCHK